MLSLGGGVHEGVEENNIDIGNSVEHRWCL